MLEPHIDEYHQAAMTLSKSLGAKSHLPPKFPLRDALEKRMTRKPVSLLKGPDNPLTKFVEVFRNAFPIQEFDSAYLFTPCYPVAKLTRTAHRRYPPEEHRCHFTRSGRMMLINLSPSWLSATNSEPKSLVSYGIYQPQSWLPSHLEASLPNIPLAAFPQPRIINQ